MKISQLINLVKDKISGKNFACFGELSSKSNPVLI